MNSQSESIKTAITTAQTYEDVARVPRKAGCLEHGQSEAVYSSKDGGGRGEFPEYKLNAKRWYFHEPLDCNSSQNFFCNPLTVGKNKVFLSCFSVLVPRLPCDSKELWGLTAYTGFRYGS